MACRVFTASRRVSRDEVLPVPCTLYPVPCGEGEEVEHFFTVYKDLEGMRVEPVGWEHVDVAKERILYSVNNYWDMRAGRLPKKA